MLTADTIMFDSTTGWRSHLEKMPEPCIDMHVNYLGQNYGKVFNDSNYLHMENAVQTGIKPLKTLKSHWTETEGIVKVTSCRYYYIDSLRYSRPYLVPEAARMLAEIGRRFQDTVEARGGGSYRIKVTSVTRTPSTVRILRRRNSNAIDSSVHTMGTTVDISHSNFICDNADLPRTVNDLKGVLAEVLFAMRNEGKCLVKMERRQPCFHITVSPHPSYRNN